MNVRKIVVVARREYAETIKTKAFLIGALFTPLLIIGLILLMARIEVQKESKPEPINLAVVDRTAQVADVLLTLVKERNEGQSEGQVSVEIVPETSDTAEALNRLKKRVKDKALLAAFYLPVGAIEGEAPCIVYRRAGDIGSRRHTAEWLVGQAVRRVRIAKAGLNVEQVLRVSRGLGFEHRDVTGKQTKVEDEIAHMMTPFAFLFLLFMGVFGVSQGLLTSVVEEKSSRVVEVLLSALSPLELMAGKILGIALVGFTLILIWATAGYGAAVWKGVEGLVQIASIGQFILYYVLGFLLFSSMLAAMGSACNTLKEAQALTAPMTIVIIVPMVCWFHFAQHPDSTLSTVLSFVPPIAPLVMIIRVTSTQAAVPIWQQIAAPLWLAVWVIVAIWAAAKVFRVGILLYGKPPGLFELVRWVRYR